MTIREKVAYLEGLAEGMNITSSDEGKLLSAIIDTLAEMADEIDSLNENALDLADELDAISDDLAEVEEFLEELDDEDDEDIDFDDWDDWDEEDDDYDYDGFNCCDNCGSAAYSIDVNCPECGAQIELDEEDIAKEEVYCTACGKLIELQIDEVDVEDENSEPAGSTSGNA